MRCRWCDGILLPEEYYDNSIARHVKLLKCKSCGRPFASRLQLVPAAAPLPECVAEGVQERTEKRRKQEETMSKLSKMTDEEKKAFYHGRALKMAEAKRAKKAANAGGATMSEQPEKGPQDGAQAATGAKLRPQRRKMDAGFPPDAVPFPGAVRPTKEEVAEERAHWKPLPPVLSGAITFNISGWSLDKLLKLKELVEG